MSNTENIPTTANNTETAIEKISPMEVAKFDNFSSVDEMLVFGEKVIKSGLTPLKKAEDVMAALLMGKALGMAPMIAMNNIHPINGRASAGIHIIQALLLKAGITYAVVEDYVPLYGFGDKSKAIHREDHVLSKPNMFEVVTVTTPSSSYDTSKIQVIMGTKPIDYRTTVKFERMVLLPTGQYKHMEVTVSRCITDFANLLDKDNWKNNMKTMLMNRVIAIGGRMIGDDALLGLYLTEEVQDFSPISNTSNVNASSAQTASVRVDDTQTVDVN